MIESTPGKGDDLMKPSLRLTLCLLAVTAAAANAAPIRYSLLPAVLHGCCIPPAGDQLADISGSFQFDPSTGTYPGWHFDISGYTSPVEHLNGVLTPATSTLVGSGSTFLQLSYGPNLGHLLLTFGVSLISFRGDVPVTVVNASRLVSFSASSSTEASPSVPEPVAGALVLVGAIVLCLWKPGRFRGNATRP
jgi:hypothetical protein